MKLNTIERKAVTNLRKIYHQNIILLVCAVCYRCWLGHNLWAVSKNYPVHLHIVVTELYFMQKVVEKIKLRSGKHTDCE